MPHMRSHRPTDARYVRTKALSEYIGVCGMTLHRWQRDKAINFPQPAVVRGIPFFDLDQIDRWMRDHVVDRTTSAVDKREAKKRGVSKATREVA
jgi:predicted DNA-binding transcriptional regulator AlpA